MDVSSASSWSLGVWCAAWAVACVGACICYGVHLILANLARYANQWRDSLVTDLLRASHSVVERANSRFDATIARSINRMGIVSGNVTDRIALHGAMVGGASERISACVESVAPNRWTILKVTAAIAICSRIHRMLDKPEAKPEGGAKRLAKAQLAADLALLLLSGVIVYAGDGVNEILNLRRYVSTLLSYILGMLNAGGWVIRLFGSAFSSKHIAHAADVVDEARQELVADERKVSDLRSGVGFVPESQVAPVAQGLGLYFSQQLGRLVDRRAVVPESRAPPPSPEIVPPSIQVPPPIHVEWNRIEDRMRQNNEAMANEVVSLRDMFDKKDTIVILVLVVFFLLVAVSFWSRKDKKSEGFGVPNGRIGPVVKPEGYKEEPEVEIKVPEGRLTIGDSQGNIVTVVNDAKEDIVMITPTGTQVNLLPVLPEVNLTSDQEAKCLGQVIVSIEHIPEGLRTLDGWNAFLEKHKEEMRQAELRITQKSSDAIHNAELAYKKQVAEIQAAEEKKLQVAREAHAKDLAERQNQMQLFLEELNAKEQKKLDPEAQIVEGEWQTVEGKKKRTSKKKPQQFKKVRKAHISNTSNSIYEHIQADDMIRLVRGDREVEVKAGNRNSRAMDIVDILNKLDEEADFEANQKEMAWHIKGKRGDEDYEYTIDRAPSPVSEGSPCFPKFLFGNCNRKDCKFDHEGWDKEKVIKRAAGIACKLGEQCPRLKTGTCWFFHATTVTKAVDAVKDAVPTVKLIKREEERKDLVQALKTVIPAIVQKAEAEGPALASSVVAQIFPQKSFVDVVKAAAEEKTQLKELKNGDPMMHEGLAVQFIQRPVSEGLLGGNKFPSVHDAHASTKMIFASSEMGRLPYNECIFTRGRILTTDHSLSKCCDRLVVCHEGKEYELDKERMVRVIPRALGDVLQFPIPKGLESVPMLKLRVPVIGEDICLATVYPKYLLSTGKVAKFEQHTCPSVDGNCGAGLISLRDGQCVGLHESRIATTNGFIQWSDEILAALGGSPQNFHSAPVSK